MDVVISAEMDALIEQLNNVRIEQAEPAQLEAQEDEYDDFDVEFDFSTGVDDDEHTSDLAGMPPVVGNIFGTTDQGNKVDETTKDDTAITTG
jgi:hypothetical protein